MNNLCMHMHVQNFDQPKQTKNQLTRALWNNDMRDEGSSVANKPQEIQKEARSRNLDKKVWMTTKTDSNKAVTQNH